MSSFESKRLSVDSLLQYSNILLEILIRSYERKEDNVFQTIHYEICKKTHHKNEQMELSIIVKLLEKLSSYYKNDQINLYPHLIFTLKLLTNTYSSGSALNHIQSTYNMLFKMLQDHVQSENFDFKHKIKTSNKNSLISLLSSLFDLFPNSQFQSKVKHEDNPLSYSALNSAIQYKEDFFCVIIEIFTHFMKNREHTEPFSSENAKFHFIKAQGPINGCYFFPFTLVLDQIPWAFKENFVFKNNFIAIFESSIELPETIYGKSIEVSQKDLDISESLEINYLKLLSRHIFLSGIRIVFSQKRIHPYFTKLLKKSQIICIQRISIKYINVLCRMSGAKLINSIPLTFLQENDCKVKQFFLASVGILREVKNSILFGKGYLICSGINKSESNDVQSLNHGGIFFENNILLELFDRIKPFSTIFITSESSCSADIIENFVVKAITFLSNIDSSVYLTQGRGKFHLSLAKILLKNVLNNSMKDVLYKKNKDFIDLTFVFFQSLFECGALLNDTSSKLDIEMPSSLFDLEDFNSISYFSWIDSILESKPQAITFLSNALHSVQLSIDITTIMLSTDGVIKINPDL